MNYFVFAGGVLITGLALTDVFITTLAPRGTGFITERLRDVIWKFFHWICGGNGANRLLNYAGMITIVALIMSWLFSLWVGNALMYISDPTSVLDSTTGASASPLSKFYFVGYVLSTMGLGDYRPYGEGWKIYTSVISFSGFIIITIAITYLVPVLSAEMRKRQASIYIHSLGTSAEDILLNNWDGKSFLKLSKHFDTISEYIMEQSQNHVAYPILHNFHSHLRRESIYVNLTALDEALTIMLLYLPDSVLPSKHEIHPLRYAITDFLTTLGAAFIKPSRHAPGPIRIDKLKEYGIPLKQENSDIKMKLERLRLRRKLLLGMMENDGWHWSNIYMGEEYSFYDVDHFKRFDN